MTARQSRSRALHAERFRWLFAGSRSFSPRAGVAQTATRARPRHGSAGSPAGAATRRARPAAAVKAALAAGDKAAKAKDWATALTQYQAAMNAAGERAGPRGDRERAVLAEDAGRGVRLLRPLPQGLRQRLGTHSKAQAHGAPEGARAAHGVHLDPRERGRAPTSRSTERRSGRAPSRRSSACTAGPHKVDVTKAGFTPRHEDAEHRRRTGRRSSTSSSCTRRRPAHLVVKEKTGQPVRVLIDGADVGAAPLELEVAPGRPRGRAPELDARVAPRSRST